MDIIGADGGKRAVYDRGKGAPKMLRQAATSRKMRYKCSRIFTVSSAQRGAAALACCDQIMTGWPI